MSVYTKKPVTPNWTPATFGMEGAPTPLPSDNNKASRFLKGIENLEPVEAPTDPGYAYNEDMEQLFLYYRYPTEVGNSFGISITGATTVVEARPFAIGLRPATLDDGFGPEIETVLQIDLEVELVPKEPDPPIPTNVTTYGDIYEAIAGNPILSSHFKPILDPAEVDTIVDGADEIESVFANGVTGTDGVFGDILIAEYLGSPAIFLCFVDEYRYSGLPLPQWYVTPAVPISLS